MSEVGEEMGRKKEKVKVLGKYLEILDQGVLKINSAAPAFSWWENWGSRKLGITTEIVRTWGRKSACLNLRPIQSWTHNSISLSFSSPLYSKNNKTYFTILKIKWDHVYQVLTTGYNKPSVTMTVIITAGVLTEDRLCTRPHSKPFVNIKHHHHCCY